MKNRRILLFTIVLAITMAGTACEGPIGPQGTQGEQGPVGPQGPQGGEGTANVIYSEWMDVEWNGANEIDYKRMDIVEPLITEEFMRTGTVLMYLYFRAETHEMVFALPYTKSGQTYVFFMRPEGYSGPQPGTFPEESGLSFYIQRDGIVLSKGLDEIRYVLIPGGVPAKTSPGFWEDYEAVTEYFGIPD